MGFFVQIAELTQETEHKKAELDSYIVVVTDNATSRGQDSSTNKRRRLDNSQSDSTIVISNVPGLAANKNTIKDNQPVEIHLGAGHAQGQFHFFRTPADILWSTSYLYCQNLNQTGVKRKAVPRPGIESGTIAPKPSALFAVTQYLDRASQAQHKHFVLRSIGLIKFYEDGGGPAIHFSIDGSLFGDWFPSMSINGIMSACQDPEEGTVVVITLSCDTLLYSCLDRQQVIAKMEWPRRRCVLCTGTYDGLELIFGWLSWFDYSDQQFLSPRLSKSICFQRPKWTNYI